MSWKFSNAKLPGVKIVQPSVVHDPRGFFFEAYEVTAYAMAGIGPFVQDNCSGSRRGTVRGLHYQSQPGQAKLVRVVAGCIWDVVVDIRPESATFGQWEAFEIDAESRTQLFVPVGFAHGFSVLSEFAEVEYKVSAPYNAATECSIHYADPELAIPWSVTRPSLSERDRTAESFAALRSRLTLRA